MSSISSDRLLGVLQSLYDAAISSARWSEALDELVDCVGAKSAIVFPVEHKRGSYARAKVGGVLRGQQAALVEFAARFRVYEDEAMSYYAKSPPQTLIRDVDIWPNLKALRRREDLLYLRQWVGLYRRIGVRLNGTPACFDACTIQFSEDVEEIPAQSIDFIKTLFPSLAKIVALNRLFYRLQDKHRSALSALDKVKIGLCIVAQSGQIVVANLECERILALDDGIALRDGRQFRCTDENDTAAIQHAIKASCAAAVGQDHSNEILLAVKRRSGARPFVIEVVPLRDSLEEIKASFTGAMVSIIDPENPRVFSMRNIARLYGLTETEADVCKLLVEGATIGYVADVRNVSTETVKSQIKAIYRKMDVSSRADLIRQVLIVNPPIE